MHETVQKQPCFTPFDLNNSPLQGRNLIEASAGTGKTFTITRIFMRLLLEKKLPLSSILVVTFTEAATLELRERIYLLLKETLTAFKLQTAPDDLFLKNLIGKTPAEEAQVILNTAITNFDSCAVYTIHGFCQRLLTDYTFESGSTFDSVLITNQQEYIDEAACDFWRINFYGASAPLIRYLRANRITPETFITIFNNYKNHSNLTIVPECSVSDFDTVEKTFSALYESVADEWSAVRSEIERLLNSKSLNAAKFKASVVVSMLTCMDQFCTKKNPDPSLFKNFEKFTSTYIAAAIKKNESPVSHYFFDSCTELLNAATVLSARYEQYIEYSYRKSLEFITNHVARTKQQQNSLYFDDLLKRVHTTLYSAETGDRFKTAVTKKYHAALIDEFQDTDPLQYDIFNQLFPPADTISFLIGDPKQAIYSFRGADIFTYLDAVQSVGSRYSLTTNYRSDPALVSAVTKLFSQSHNPFLVEQIKITDVLGGVKESVCITKNGTLPQKPLKLWFQPEEMSTQQIREYLPNVVAQEIAALVAGEASEGPAHIGGLPVRASNCAILVRTNNEAFNYQNALAELSIPSVVASGSSVYETPEALELFRLLSALAEPSEELICAALTLPFFGFDSERLQAVKADDEAYVGWVQIFNDAQQMWLRDGFGSMIHGLYNKINLEAQILSMVCGERKLTNYLHLTELLERESQRHNKRTSALTAFLTQQIRNDNSAASDDEIIRLESDDDTVKILTIHKSKGLEFDIVFCPTIGITTSSRKPDSSPYIIHDQDNKPLFVLGKEAQQQNKPQLDHEVLAENLRLLYVALTRAKSCCYVMYAKSDAAATSALSWLLFGTENNGAEVTALQLLLKQLSPNELYDRLKAFASTCDAVEAVLIPELKQCTPLRHAQSAMELNCRTLTKPIPAPWIISSYSYLTRGHSQTGGHFDEVRFDETESGLSADSQIRSGNTMFTFPRGAKAGTMLHAVLESVDFSAVPPERELLQIVNEKLREVSFDLSWGAAVASMIETAAGITLSSGIKQFSLSAVNRTNAAKEMEFHFPVQTINHTDIESVFASPPDLFEEPYTAEGLQFHQLSGFLKGYIDMVFLHDGQYFIIDWKSNYLGDTHSDYAPEKLVSVMNAEHYVLQYHLYTVALDQYLRVHQKGYEYGTHFGGVFYIFLRGIALGADTGIYFKKPDYRVIESLRRKIIS